MMTFFRVGLILIFVLSAMMCIAGTPDQKKEGRITFAISGVLFLLSEVVKWMA